MGLEEEVVQHGVVHRNPQVIISESIKKGNLFKLKEEATKCSRSQPSALD